MEKKKISGMIDIRQKIFIEETGHKCYKKTYFVINYVKLNKKNKNINKTV